MSQLRETGSAHKFPHAALLDGGLIPAVDLCNVVALDLCDVLVHRQVSRCRLVQYQNRTWLGGRIKGVPKGTVKSYRKLQSSPPWSARSYCSRERISLVFIKLWAGGVRLEGSPTMSLLSSPYFPVWDA